MHPNECIIFILKKIKVFVNFPGISARCILGNCLHLLIFSKYFAFFKTEVFLFCMICQVEVSIHPTHVKNRCSNLIVFSKLHRLEKHSRYPYYFLNSSGTSSLHCKLRLMENGTMKITIFNDRATKIIIFVIVKYL